MTAVAAVLLASSLAAPTVRDVYGVAVPESVFAGGRMLFLNGTGLRKKAIFKAI